MTDNNDEQDVILYSGINELGFRQYYRDEAKTQPVCAVTLDPYTNSGAGVLSVDLKESE